MRRLLHKGRICATVLRCSGNIWHYGRITILHRIFADDEAVRGEIVQCLTLFGERRHDAAYAHDQHRDDFDAGSSERAEKGQPFPFGVDDLDAEYELAQCALQGEDSMIPP
jgi:hypothetical protein